VIFITHEDYSGPFDDQSKECKRVCQTPAMTLQFVDLLLHFGSNNDKAKRGLAIKKLTATRISRVSVVFLLAASTPLLAAAQSQTTRQIVAECDRLAVRLNSISRLQYQYGRSLLNDEQDDEALKWYRKAAEQGHAKGQTSLGMKYESGSGVSKNATTAALWYSEAANAGDHRAQLYLGMLYLDGRGARKD
jgi:hypothetical protein